MFDKVMLGLDIKVQDDDYFLHGEMWEIHRKYQKWMQVKNGWTPIYGRMPFWTQKHCEHPDQSEEN